MNKQVGISLVELMISMTLGLVLTLGIFSLFATSQRSYQTMRELTQMQENAYFAFNFLAEPLREVGFFQGCPVAINVEAPSNEWHNFHKNPVQRTSDGSLRIRSPDVSQATNVTLVVAETVTVSDIPDNLSANDPVLMISRDCSSAVFSRVSEINANNSTITLNSDGLVSSILYPLRDQVFSITTNSEGIPQLVRDGDPLVTGVRDLKLRAINHNSDRDSGVLRASQYSDVFNETTIGVEMHLEMISESGLDDGDQVVRTFTQTIAMRNRQVQ